MFFALVRAACVWVATLILIGLSLRDVPNGGLVPALLGFFFTIPVLVFLVVLHFVEGGLLASTLPVMSLAIGPLLLAIGCITQAGPIAEVAWPMGLAWLPTAALRLLTFRPANSWP